MYNLLHDNFYMSLNIHASSRNIFWSVSAIILGSGYHMAFEEIFFNCFSFGNLEKPDKDLIL